QALTPGVAGGELVETGEALYHAGNADTSVPSCAACHGPAGAGLPGAHFPRRSAQHADYTAKRLRDYRNGVNSGEDDAYSNIMVGVSQSLSDEEIEAVSSYIEGLHRQR